MTTKQAANQADPVKVARPLVLHPWEVRGLLSGSITQIRRPVKFSPAETGMPRSTEFDPSRAWADRGFPDSDGPHKGEYRYGYLHVPVAIPRDGWAADPKDDAIWRVRCEDEPGDLVWGRETWAPRLNGDDTEDPNPRYVKYRADKDRKSPYDSMDWHRWPDRWKSSTSMPRHASRLTLEILSVRAERAHEATDADGLACGARHFPDIPLDPWHRPGTKDRWSLGDPKTTGECMGSPRLALGNWWNYTYGPKDGWPSREWVWVRTVRVLPREATP